MFTRNNCNGIVFYTVPSFERTGLVRHCITTRMGGVSEGCYSSMNFRYNCSDTPDNVNENFRRISEAVGFGFGDIVLSKQVHEDKIITITEDMRGNGVLYPNKFDSADGLITAEKVTNYLRPFGDKKPFTFPIFLHFELSDVLYLVLADHFSSFCLQR